MPKKIYIAGLITGQEDLAWAQFAYAETKLRQKGYLPINPMRLAHDHGKTWEEYMRTCIPELCFCDAIFLIDGWERSTGAMLEFNIAMKLKLEWIKEL